MIFGTGDAQRELTDAQRENEREKERSCEAPIAKHHADHDRRFARSRLARCFARLRSWIAIDNAISRSTVRVDRDWRRDLAKHRLRRSRSREASIGAVLRDRRRDQCFTIDGVFVSSLVLPCASPVPEIIWSENRNGNEFPWSTLLFYGQLKMISGKFNFPNQPNSLFYGKWFSETIFTQNKYTLWLNKEKDRTTHDKVSKETKKKERNFMANSW